MPQLALSWTWSADNKTLTLKLRPGVTFQNGEAFDAEAVKYNLDRYRTAPDSLRKSEIASIDHVDVVDPLTVALVLKQPDAALVAQLTDRSGMMMAPKATATGNPTAAPVCAGPYKLRPSASPRTGSCSTGSPATGTPPPIISTASPSCRSPTRRCGWPISSRAGSTSSSAWPPPT